MQPMALKNSSCNRYLTAVHCAVMARNRKLPSHEHTRQILHVIKVHRLYRGICKSSYCRNDFSITDTFLASTGQAASALLPSAPCDTC